MITPEQGREIIRKQTLMMNAVEYGEEYISEAEGQEGEEYWELFETEQDVIDDLKLYMDALDDFDDTEVL